MLNMRFSKPVLYQSNGYWRAYLRFKPEDGDWKRISKSFGKATRDFGKRKARKACDEWHDKACRELAAAEERLTQSEYSREREEARHKSVPKYVGEMIDRLDKTRAIEPSTVRSYYAMLKHIRDGLSGVELANLTSKQIQDWEAWLLSHPFSEAVVIKSHRLLGRALKEAVLNGYIDRNPIEGVKPPKRPRKRPPSLDRTGVKSFLDLLDGLGICSETVAGYLALYTGMRCGEICGLQWRSVDMENREITVEQAIGIDTNSQPYVKSAKNERIRTIPYAEPLASVLAEWYRLQSEACEIAGVPVDATYVIGDAVGFMSPTLLSRRFTRIFKSSDIVCTNGSRPSLHVLRHTFATLSIAAGVDVKTVSSYLGHANASMTLDVYASSDEHAKRAAAPVISAAISGDEPRLFSNLSANSAPGQSELEIVA